MADIIGWGWTWNGARRQHYRSLGVTDCGRTPPWYLPDPRWRFDESLPRCRRCER